MDFKEITLKCIFFSAVLVLCENKANTKWQLDVLQKTFGKTRHFATGTALQEAREFIKNKFTEYGLAVISQPFETETENVTGENIIGVLKGKNYNTVNDTFYGIGTHYDTTPDTPGVDDNGSGVVAMLEAARILAEAGQHENSVFFIAFDLEEWTSACERGTCGSQYFVNNWPLEMAGPLPKTRFGGIVVMDTVMNFVAVNSTQRLSWGFDLVFPDAYTKLEREGFAGDFLLVASRQFDGNVAGPLIKSWNELSDKNLEIEPILLPIDNPLVLNQHTMNFRDFFRSDHSQFWYAGLPAVFITDTADFRGFMQQCYHQQCDNVTNIDDDNMEFLGKVTDSLVLTMTELSPLVPTTNNNPSLHTGNTVLSVVLIFLCEFMQAYKY